MARLVSAWLVAPPKFATGSLTLSERSIAAMRAIRANPLHLLSAHEVCALDDPENVRALAAGGSGRIESLIVFASVVGPNVRFAKFAVVTDTKVSETTVCRPSELAP
ncbi:MAG: hypothetical protein J0L58_13780 [Burkholderiales bacterium]|nr:hypothetical protein [Burkholderiales bacterium]